jgi:short-subunit dehydrogenase
MNRILIIGAASAMAEATARLFAARGDALFLVARNAAQLDAIASDLKIRGAERVGQFVLDANDLPRHDAMLAEAEQFLGGLDTVLIAHGTLSDQTACQQSASQTLAEINTNALSVVALLTPIANRMEAQRHGSIAVISSVAGDRGRQSNYVYGAAKAMVTAFLSGLRQRLWKSGVAVITIKPGFVDTPMTRAFNKGPLWAKPEQVAQQIVRAIDHGTPVAYVPGFWRWIMRVIRHIPERIFRQIKL